MYLVSAWPEENISLPLREVGENKFMKINVSQAVIAAGLCINKQTVICLSCVSSVSVSSVTFLTAVGITLVA